MKHLFIINPAAGKGKSLDFINQIRKAFEDRPEDLVIEITEYPGHATKIAADYSAREVCRVYSVGGDGTLNEVLNGMMNSGCSLAVIPAGSGNDFIRSVAEDCSRNIIERTLNGKEKPVDIAKANNRYFINISSVGFDAEVTFNARNFKKVRWISGNVAYILGILKTVFNYRNNNLKIIIDGTEIKRKLLLAAIANGRYYGGGMMPVPGARLDDGELDICLIDALKVMKILVLFPRYIKGKHLNMKEVDIHKGRNVRIECDHEIALNIDGDVEMVKSASFEIVRNGISIVIPQE